MKIIPNSLPDEENTFVGIESMRVTYVQSGDTWKNSADGDNLLTVESVPIDTEQYTEGEDPDAYYILKTDRWAFDNPKEIETILNDFTNRLKMVTDTDNETNVQREGKEEEA